MGLFSHLRAPPVTLFLIFAYSAQFLLSALNWWWFVSKERALFGASLVDAHLAFVCIGTVVFTFLASPFLFWPYRYGRQMKPRSIRNAIISCIVIVFFTHDFPLWLIEFWMVWQFGWIYEVQGISIILLTITTAWGTFCVWLAYSWKLSKLLQVQFGGGAPVTMGGLTSAKQPTFQRI